MEWRHTYTICSKRAALTVLLMCIHLGLSAQQHELNTGWRCARASAVSAEGNDISKTNFSLKAWMPAVVPGTVLASFLHNKLIPDPFFGMNNDRIPDIYNVGKDYYTYWFATDFSEPALKEDEHVWLQFRGVNNSFDACLNGNQLSDHRYKSMYLRQEYDITRYLHAGSNRLAVKVYPPDPVGNPNGGQGGDGTIAHNITNQYAAGWDWIQPVRDRNTGIWDKVLIRKTKQVAIANTHVVTLVPGRRWPGLTQDTATIKVTTEVANASNRYVQGTLMYSFAGEKMSVKVKLAAGARQLVSFPDYVLHEPKLWWPNGYGPQNLYKLKVTFLVNDTIVSDEEQLSFGVRDIKGVWNTHTQSREVQVNGQKIFIKGGNRILSDEMLRCSPERYDAELRYHHDMNLNLIRVWGGGMTERPEFYDACDKYGMLVMQDFWVSGDCNGRWYDPLKLDDTTGRRNYPDNHRQLVETMADQVKMLRNHPSLAIWCGGNEIRPPADVLRALRDSLLPALDGTHIFFEYSNDDSMSYQAHDGPYTIQPDTFFWSHRSYGFNSEVGSVGIGDYESLQRFIPEEDMVVPWYDTVNHKWQIDSVWQYHKYCSYDSSVEVYGHPNGVKDFAAKAQLVNYNQYRSLMEGYTSHMWDWYTGVIEWKTQNPWTAMLGQMYDVYLDPNACMYGMSEGAKPLHIMYDQVHHSVVAVNNGFDTVKIMPGIRFYRKKDEVHVMLRTFDLPPGSITTLFTFEWASTPSLDELSSGVFLGLLLVDSATGKFDNNLYALPDIFGSYDWLSAYPQVKPEIIASSQNDSTISVTIKNDISAPLAFFNHISLVDKKTKKRILPVFCNNNYISVPPGEVRTVSLSFPRRKGAKPIVCVEGWNVDKQFIEPK